MNPVDIIVLCVVIVIVLLLSIYFIRKKLKGKSVLSECDCCSSKNNLVKQYHKKYKSNNSNKCCCSNKEKNKNFQQFYTNRKSYATADYIILEEKDYIEIEDVVYSLLVANLPIKLHKRFETYPEGENYKVYSEDDYLASKEESGEGNPFDALKDLDLGENNDDSGEESLEIASESEENKEN